MFSGCGKSDMPEEGKGADVKLNGKAIYPIECDDTLTFWFNGTAVWNKKYENFADTPLGQELLKKTGVKIEYEHPTAGQGNEQFQLLLASNDLPDIVNNKWYSFPGGPDEAIEQDYVYELTDIFKKYCPAITKLLKENEDWDKGIKTDKGLYYVFPQFYGREELLKANYGPVIRKDFMDKLNLDLPVTINDWEELLTAFKNDGVDTPYRADVYTMTNQFYPAFGGFYGWYLDDGVVKFGQAQPQYKEFVTKMHDWYEKGLIHRDFAIVDSKTFNSDVLNGKIGSYLGYAGSALGTFLQNAESLGIEGFDLVGAQYPVMNEGDVNAEYSSLGQDVSTGITTAISKNCKNVELAARFLDYGFTEEGHAVYNFGIEGESFDWIDKDGEKYPMYSELVYDNPEGMTISDVLHMYTRAAHANVPMIVDVRHIIQYYPYQQQKDAQVEWAKTNMASHNMPPIYILSEESDTDSDIMAAINTYVDEMTIKFITGREPLENFDKYFAQLEKFGIDQSTQFRQQAYQRYLER